MIISLPLIASEKDKSQPATSQTTQSDRPGFKQLPLARTCLECISFQKPRVVYVREDQASGNEPLTATTEPVVGGTVVLVGTGYAGYKIFRHFKPTPKMVAQEKEEMAEIEHKTNAHHAESEKHKSDAEKYKSDAEKHKTETHKHKSELVKHILRPVA